MAISLVQSKKNNSGASGVNTLAVTMTSTPTAGNTIFLAASASTFLSITGGLNISWEMICNPGQGTVPLILAIGRVFASASATITVNAASSTAGIAMVAAEFSGSNIRLDRLAYTNAGSGSTLASGDTATTSTANELWVGALATRVTSGSTFSSPTNGFTILDSDKTSIGTNNDRSVALLTKSVSSTGAANAGATADGGSAVWAATVATFEEVTIGGASQTNRIY